MYYFTIKNITKSDFYNSKYGLNTYYTYYVLDIENNNIFVKNDDYTVNKTFINNVLCYEPNNNLKWDKYNDSISFDKCKNNIINWDFIENGNATLFLKNVIVNILIEIRNKKIDKILDVLF